MIVPASVTVVGDPPVARSSDAVAMPTEIRPTARGVGVDRGREGRVGRHLDVEAGGQSPATVADTDGVPVNEALGNGKSPTAPVPPIAMAFDVPSPAGGTMVDNGWPDGREQPPAVRSRTGW